MNQPDARAERGTPDAPVPLGGIRALVVDDEPPARRRLSRMLRALPEVEVIGELEDGHALLARLPELAADVVFLDIRMPGLDGLTLAAQARALPAVVFVTAYGEHAVDAFDVDAVDYLVKPVRAERLAAAIERVRARAFGKAPPPAPTVRITTTASGRIEVFEPSRITRFWAAHKYTTFLVDDCERLTEESLSTLAQRLAAHGFLRVHRAELIRADAVRALESGPDGHVAVLSDGQRVRVSRRCVGELKRTLR